MKKKPLNYVANFISKNVTAILFTLIFLVIVIILFSMLYTFLGNKILQDVEKRMNIKELSIYDFEASHQMIKVNEQDVPELTLKWKTTNPSFTIYDIISPSFNTNFKDDQYKSVHIVNILLNPESISSTLIIKIAAKDVVANTYTTEFYYLVKNSEPEAGTQ